MAQTSTAGWGGVLAAQDVLLSGQLKITLALEHLGKAAQQARDDEAELAKLRAEVSQLKEQLGMCQKVLRASTSAKMVSASTRKVSSRQGNMDAVSIASAAEMKQQDATAWAMPTPPHTIPTEMAMRAVESTEIVNFNEEENCSNGSGGGDMVLDKCCSIESVNPDSDWKTSIKARRTPVTTHLPVCGEDADSDEGRECARVSGGGEEFAVLDLWAPGMLRQMIHNETKSMKGVMAVCTSEDAEGNPLQPTPSVLEVVGAKIVVHPQNPKRLVWDFVSLALVTYDMAVLPMVVFNYNEDSFMIFMTWLTRIFWTLDLPASMCTGFIDKEGTIVVSLKAIFLRYLKSYLLLDVVLVLFEWVELAWSSQQAVASSTLVGKAGRGVRLIRMVRLLRILKLKESLETFVEQMHSESIMLGLDMLKVVLGIVALCHFIACIWYWIGSGLTSGGKKTGWVNQGGWEDEDIYYRYTSSLHWSLSQLTGGMDEITATNTTERVFALCTFICSFIIAAAFVSNLTSALTRLELITTRRRAQIAALRKYLVYHGISRGLMQRLQRNALHRMSEKEKILSESSVELIGVISASLLVELHFAMYNSILEHHEFFLYYMTECPHVMRRVSHSAISNQHASGGDIFFCTGEIPAEPKMYILRSGSLQYTNLIGTSTRVAKHRVIAEPVLWTSWIHRGVCAAEDDCETVIINAKEFMAIVGQYNHPDFDPSRYAAAFIHDLNVFQGWVTDVSSMPDLSYRLSMPSEIATSGWRPRIQSSGTAWGEKNGFLNRSRRRSFDLSQACEALDREEASAESSGNGG